MSTINIYKNVYNKLNKGNARLFNIGEHFSEVIMIGSNKESSLAQIADFMVRVPTNTKMKFPDEIPSHQIMTSLFEQFLLLYGDIIAKIIVERNNIDMNSLWEYHANLE